MKSHLPAPRRPVAIGRKALVVLSALLGTLGSACRAVETTPSTLGEAPSPLELLKNNCADAKTAIAITTVRLPGISIIRLDPDLCASSRPGGFALADDGRKPLFVIVDGSSQRDRLVTTAQSDLTQRMTDAGFEVVQLHDVSSGENARDQIRALYPYGYDGTVEAVVIDHGNREGLVGGNRVSGAEIATGLQSGFGAQSECNILFGNCYSGQTARSAAAVDGLNSVASAAASNQVAWSGESSAIERAVSYRADYLIAESRGEHRAYDVNGDNVITTDETIPRGDIGPEPMWEARTEWRLAPGGTNWQWRQPPLPESDYVVEDTARTSNSNRTMYTDFERRDYPQTPEVISGGVHSVLPPQDLPPQDLPPQDLPPALPPPDLPPAEPMPPADLPPA